ncbi:hypothetical protein ACFLRF_01550 [Candidatus Altiarchaeota archaeon]
MRYGSFALLLILSISVANAESKALHQDAFEYLWETDIGGTVSKVYTLDLDGDGSMELIADSVLTTSFGRSGLVYALGTNGEILWRYHAGLLNDIYVTPGQDIIVGTGGQVALLNPDGSSKWKRSSKSSNIQKIYGQSIYADDFHNDGNLNIITSTNFGMKGSSIFVWDAFGNKISKIDFKGSRFPKVLTSGDLDGNGVKELIAGVVLFAPNTVAGSINPAYNKPGKIRVLALDGGIVWEADTSKGVSQIVVADLDADGSSEVIVGMEGKFTVFGSDGSFLWDKEVAGRVRSILVDDIDGEPGPEILVGAGIFQVFDNQGKVLWRYTTGSVYSSSVNDLDGDGEKEIVVASQELRVLDNKGKLIWKGDRTEKIFSVIFSDMQADTHPEIISAGDDDHVRLYSSEKFGKTRKAEFHYLEADRLFKSKDYNASKYQALKAEEYYTWLGDDAGSTKSQNLAQKGTIYMGADSYYELAMGYLEEGNHGNASYYASKAMEDYRKVQDLKKLNELNSIVNRGRMEPAAVKNLDLARGFYGTGDWVNASFYAGKASEQFSYIGIIDGLNEAERIKKWSTGQVKAEGYIELAENHTIFGEYQNATHYLDIANRTYAEVNDTSGMKRVGDMMDEIRQDEGRGSNLVYLGILVVVLVVLLMAFILVRLAMIMLRKAGGHDLGNISDMFKWITWKPATPKRKDDGGRNSGLRGI